MNAPLRSLAQPTIFEELLADLAPRDGDAVVLIKSYFDESFDNNLLCVAGYAFSSAAARALDADWDKMLCRYKRLPYFRMSACNAGQYPFDRLDKDQCIAIQTEAIGLISRFASMGFAATINIPAFYKIVTKNGFVSSPYEFCVWGCLSEFLAFADREKITVASYFFEAGHQDGPKANALMEGIFRVPNLRKDYRYKSHSFLDKDSAGPMQAADILSWQWYKQAKRSAKGLTTRRADCQALLSGTPHYIVHWDTERLQKMMDSIIGLGGPNANQIAREAIRRSFLEASR
jgi:hypothetical protein